MLLWFLFAQTLFVCVHFPNVTGKVAGGYESCPELENLRLQPLLCSHGSPQLLCQEEGALCPVAGALLPQSGM